jgi:hypothetical protein
MEHELEKLVEKCQQVEIIESFYDKENWAVKVKRIY